MREQRALVRIGARVEQQADVLDAVAFVQRVRERPCLARLRTVREQERKAVRALGLRA
jgi:hypothetical protein